MNTLVSKHTDLSLPLFGGIGLWAGSVAVLSASGTLAPLEGLGTAPAIVATIVVPVLLYFSFAAVRNAVDAIGLKGLLAVHLLRYLGAIWILGLGSAQIMNPLLAELAGWGDVVAASVALVVLVLPFSRRRYIFAHIVSLADFATSLTVGLYLTIVSPEQMAGATRLPVSMILFFIIGFYSANSIFSLSALLQERSTLVNKAKGVAP